MKQRVRDFCADFKNIFSPFILKNSRVTMKELLDLEMRKHGMPVEYRHDTDVIIKIARYLPLTPADLLGMYCHIYHKGWMDFDDFMSFRYHGVPLFRKETKQLWRAKGIIPFERFREELLSLVQENGLFSRPL